MSDLTSSKSLALFVTNDTLHYLTQTSQDDENFYSEPVKITLPDLTKYRNYEDIEGIVKANLPLLLYYNNVTICYLSKPVNVVPNTYLADQLQQQLLRLNSDQKIQVLNSPLRQIDASIIFNGYTPLTKVFQNLPNFSSAKYIHTANLFIDRDKLITEKNQIFARLIEQKLEICIYKKSIFTLYNIYDINTDEDIIYYILNLIEQLKLNPLDSVLTFEGGIEHNHHVMEQLPKYINDVVVDENYNDGGLKYLLYKIFECE